MRTGCQWLIAGLLAAVMLTAGARLALADPDAGDESAGIADEPAQPAGEPQPDPEAQPDPPAQSQPEPAPETPANIYRRGAAALVKGEWVAAETAFRACLENWPDHPDVLALLGIALHGQQRIAEALAILLRAIERKTKYEARTQYYAGLCQARLGNTDAARTAFLQVLTRWPESVPAQQIRSEFGEELGGMPTTAGGQDTPPDGVGSGNGEVPPTHRNDDTATGPGDNSLPTTPPPPEWRVEFSMGAAIDTEPGQSRDLVTLTGTMLDADGNWSTSIALGFEPRGVPFQVSADASHLDYFNADPTDYSEIGLKLGGDIAAGGDLALSPAGSVSTSWVSDEPWETNIAVGATLAGIEGDSFAFAFSLSFGWSDHTTTYRRYDGGFVDTSATAIWLQPETATVERGSVSFGYSWRAAREADLAYQLVSLNGGISLRLETWLSLDGRTAVRWQAFSGDDLTIRERRLDLRWSLGATLAWLPQDWMTISLAADLFINGSTIGDYTYERLLLSLSVTVLFPADEKKK